MRPATDDNWQDAVDAAHLIMTLELGRIYRLVKIIPEFDIEECIAILAEGRDRGILPNAELTNLVGAVDGLLAACDTRVRVLQNDDWLGAELVQLRRAVEGVKKERTFNAAY